MFAETVKNLEVEQGTAALIWLGQAGFMIKTAGGKIVVIDPYLTDYVYEAFKDEEGLGYKRVTAPLFEPGEIDIDILLCSHEHGDHLDIYAMPELLGNPGMVCYTNAQSIAELEKNSIDTSRVTAIAIGDSVDMGEFTLRVVDCDHGSSTPGAMGFILDFGFRKIYYSGDTSLNLQRLEEAVAQQPDVGLLPINGAFGNLDSVEAAKLAKELKLKVCVPHHFWTFPRHFGDPMKAIETFPKYAPDCELAMMTPGTVYVVK